MMHEVGSHGGGMSATSAVHINLFRTSPDRREGARRRQKARLGPSAGPPGEDQCCFGFTEAGDARASNTTRIKDFCAERSPAAILVHGQKVWTSTAAGRQQDHVAEPGPPNTRIASVRPTASRSSTTDSRPVQDRCSSHSQDGPPRRSILTPSSSMALFIPGNPTGVGEEGKGFLLHPCTASIPSAS